MPQQFIDWLGHRNIARMPRSYGDQVSADLVGINHARLTVPHETTLTKINFTVIGAPTPCRIRQARAARWPDGSACGGNSRLLRPLARSHPEVDGRWSLLCPEHSSPARHFLRVVVSAATPACTGPPFCLPQRKWDRAYGGGATVLPSVGHPLPWALGDRQHARHRTGQRLQGRSKTTSVRP